MAKAKAKTKSNTEIDALLDVIDKKYGDGTVIQGRGAVIAVDAFTTGVIALDIALGVRGLPRGRIIEIFGGESSGKTTTCLQFIASCQQHIFNDKPGIAAFIDAEHAFDPDWATKNGVDMDSLIISQPDHGEQALEITEMMSKSGHLNLIVIDSVAALVPKAELEGEISDTQIGVQARMMSKALRKISAEAYKTKTTIVFVNQVREKIGVSYGNPETTPGGRALKFYASVRLQLNKGSAVKKGEEVIGFRPTAKVIKNKVAPPFTSAQFDICVGKPSYPIFGIDKMGSLLDVGQECKVVECRGSSYRYGAQVLGNGSMNASLFLQTNVDIAEKIRQEIYDKMLGAAIPQDAIEDSIEDDIRDDDA